MKHKRGGLFMLLGLLLLLGAAVLCYANLRAEQTAAEETARVLEQMRLEIPNLAARMDANENAEVNQLDATDEANALAAQEKDPRIDTPEMQSILIDGQRYIGEIEIPAMDLSLPVMEEWSYPNLKISPCRYSGSYLDDSLVIAGHSVPAHFRKLRKIKVGERVVFTDVMGNVIEYQVVLVETLSPRQVTKLLTGNWDLTLFTCTSGGERRVTVRCDRV